MSLRLRLNLIIAAICLAALLLGSVVTVINARQSVFEEITSSLALAQKLVRNGTPGSVFSELDQIRHLRIAVEDNASVNLALGEAELQNVPQLFTGFVRPSAEQLSIWVDGERGRSRFKLVADPNDEIREAWRETLVFIGLLVLLTFSISVCVFVVVGRALQPVDRILQGFIEVEKGDYQERLEDFELPEFSRISKGFNHMSQMLAQAKSENHRLSKKNLDVRENERRYLARELHDEMGQSLSAIKALSASVKQGLQSSQPPNMEPLNKINAICDHLFEVVRNRMRQLTPPLLAEFGLRTAVEELVEQWQGTGEVAFTMAASIEGVAEPLAIHLYRVIQESLTNSLKYSGAGYIRIEIKQVEQAGVESVGLYIEDNGAGFDPQKVEWGGGFAGIKERAESFGGSFQVNSSVGKGVRLSVLIPIEKLNE